MYSRSCTLALYIMCIWEINILKIKKKKKSQI